MRIPTCDESFWTNAPPGNPYFATVMQVTRAVGMQLRIVVETRTNIGWKQQRNRWYRGDASSLTLWPATRREP